MGGVAAAPVITGMAHDGVARVASVGERPREPVRAKPNTVRGESTVPNPGHLSRPRPACVRPGRSIDPAPERFGVSRREGNGDRLWAHSGAPITRCRAGGCYQQRPGTSLVWTHYTTKTAYVRHFSPILSRHIDRAPCPSDFRDGFRQRPIRSAKNLPSLAWVQQPPWHPPCRCPFGHAQRRRGIQQAQTSFCQGSGFRRQRRRLHRGCTSARRRSRTGSGSRGSALTPRPPPPARSPR